MFKFGLCHPKTQLQSTYQQYSFRLHSEASSNLDKPKANLLPQFREAKGLLAKPEILTSDAVSHVDAIQMDTTLADLQRRQGRVDAMIVQVATRKRSTNTGAWGWIVILVLLVLPATVVV